LAAIQFRVEPRTVIAARVPSKRAPLLGSEFQLDLEIALTEGSAPSGVSDRPKMR